MNNAVVGRRLVALCWVLACMASVAATYEDGTVTERVVIPEGETLTITDPQDVTFAGGISMTNAALKIESTDVRPLVFSLSEDSATATVIVEKTSVDSITNFSAKMTGSLIGTAKETVPCFVTRKGSVVTCQFQYTNGTTLRCVIVEYAQNEQNVTARVVKRTYKTSASGIAPGELDMSTNYTDKNSRTQVYLTDLTVHCSELSYNQGKVVLAGPTDATNATIEVSGTFNAPKMLEVDMPEAMPASSAISVGAYGTLLVNAQHTKITGITKETRIEVFTNGCLNIAKPLVLSANNSYVMIDGGEMCMCPAGDGDDSYGYAYDLTLKNGARLTGRAPRFRRTGSGGHLHVSGTTPSFVETGLIVWGEINKVGTLTLDVADVTSDAMTDLTVAKSLRPSATAGYGDVKVVKTGDGTVRLNGGWSLPQAPKLQAGTWLQGTNGTTGVGLSFEGGSFAVAEGTTNEIGVLAVSASGTISVGADAKLSFAASADEQWAADAIVTVVGDLTSDTLRFGTDASGLTRVQLKQMRAGEKKVMLDANGYLRERPDSGLMVIFR